MANHPSSPEEQRLIALKRRLGRVELDRQTMTHIESMFSEDRNKLLENAYSDDEIKNIIAEGLKDALNWKLLTERDIQRRLLVEQSTVNRWRHGSALPPKKKQLMLVDLIHEGMIAKVEALKAEEAELIQEVTKLSGSPTRPTPGKVISLRNRQPEG